MWLAVRRRGGLTDDVRNLKHLVDYHDGLYFEASKIEAYTFDMTG